MRLERAFGIEVSDEEAREMDEILTGRSSEDLYDSYEFICLTTYRKRCVEEYDYGGMNQNLNPIRFGKTGIE